MLGSIHWFICSGKLSIAWKPHEHRSIKNTKRWVQQEICRVISSTDSSCSFFPSKSHCYVRLFSNFLLTVANNKVTKKQMESKNENYTFNWINGKSTDQLENRINSNWRIEKRGWKLLDINRRVLFPAIRVWANRAHISYQNFLLTIWPLQFIMKIVV